VQRVTGRRIRHRPPRHQPSRDAGYGLVPQSSGLIPVNGIALRHTAGLRRTIYWTDDQRTDSLTSPRTRSGDYNPSHRLLRGRELRLRFTSQTPTARAPRAAPPPAGDIACIVHVRVYRQHSQAPSHSKTAWLLCGSRVRRARMRSIVATCTQPGLSPGRKPCAASRVTILTPATSP